MESPEQPSTPTTVILIDDHALVRSGFKAIIETDPAFTVVGEASNAADAFRIAAELKPSLAVVDYALPGGNGVSIARQLLADSPGIRILIVTGFHDMNFAPDAVAAGVLGFVRKESDPAELLEALRTVALGRMHLCEEASSALARSVRSAASKPAEDSGELSERERQVLKHVVDGLRNKEIADKLGVSVKSIETYRSRVMKKLGCTNTAELVRQAITLGL